MTKHIFNKRLTSRRTQPELFLRSRLRLSVISPADASYAGIQACSVGKARALGKVLPQYCTDGFLIRYHDLDGNEIPHQWRWRNDPSKVRGFAAIAKSMLQGKYKYAQAKGSGCFVYYPLVEGLHWREILGDTTQCIVVVEGELKSLSLCLAGVPAIGIGGVWNWRNSARELLPELAQWATNHRPVLVIFDSDAADNPLIAGAQYQLARAVLNAGGEPHIIPLPELSDDKHKKIGADDFVRLHPGLRQEKLLEAFLSLEDKHQFALAAELYRLNAEYVCNESGHIIRLDGKREEDHWEEGKFRRVVEPRTVVVLSADGKPKQVSVAAAWLAWSLRNTVKGLVYRPMAQPVPVGDATYIYDEYGRRCLNTWTGWASDPEEDKEGVAEYWTRLLDHLFRQTQSETAQETELRLRCRLWFEMWWAYPIQNPTAGKLYSTAVLMGQSGGGKSLVGNMVRDAVYGRHFHEITQIDLAGHFNGSWMESTSLVMGSEITGKASNKRDVSEFLKHLITGDDAQIRIKYVPEYYIRNVINLYFTTNYGDSFFLDDDDRRYFCWEIPDITLREALRQEWIDRAVQYAQSPKGKAALHYHLLTLPVKEDLFNPKGSPPDTAAKRWAKEYSQNDGQQWVAGFCDDPASTLGPGREADTVWRMEEAFETFRLHNRTYTRNGFLKCWRERFHYVGRAELVVRDGGKESKKKTGLWVKKPDLTSPSVQFPTLEEAKRNFERQHRKLKQRSKKFLPQAYR